MDRTLYVIETEEGGDRLKIGVAYKVRARLGQIQNSSPVPLIFTFTATCESADAARLEARVHQMLASARTHGEWFLVTRAQAVDAITNASAELGIDLAVVPADEFNSAAPRKTPIYPKVDKDRPFADEIQGWRTRLGLTRKEAADALGVALTTFNGWLDGRGCGREIAMRRLMTMIEKQKEAT